LGEWDELPFRQTCDYRCEMSGGRSILMDIVVLVIELSKAICTNTDL